MRGYRIGRAPNKFPKVQAAACSVSALLQLKREAGLISACNIRRSGGEVTMQGCAFRRAHAGRNGGVICARALGARTGELPADHGLGSRGRESAAARSRGLLAQLVEASQQSVILLRKHFLLTNPHYCYSNTSLGRRPRKSHQGPASRFERQYGAGQAPMFRSTRYATRALPERRGELHPSFCQDRSPVLQAILLGVDRRPSRSNAVASLGRERPCPKCDEPASARGAADRSMGSPLERGHPCHGMTSPTAAERRGNVPWSAVDGSQEPYPYRDPYVNLYFCWDSPKLNI